MAYTYKKVTMKASDSVFSSDLSADNKLFVAGQQSRGDGTPAVSLWRFDDDHLAYHGGIDVQKDEMILCTRFCNHDRYVVYYQTPDRLSVYDLKTSSPLGHSIQVGNLKSFDAAAHAPKIISSGKKIAVWNVETWDCLWEHCGTLPENRDDLPVPIGAISRDGNTLAVGGTGGHTIDIFDIEKDQPIQTLTDSPAKFERLYFTKDNDYLICVEYSGKGFHVWDLAENRKILPNVLTEKFKGFAANILPTRNRLVLGGLGGALICMDLLEEKVASYDKVHDAGITEIKVTNDEKKLVVSSEDGSVSVVETLSL